MSNKSGSSNWHKTKFLASIADACAGSAVNFDLLGSLSSRPPIALPPTFYPPSDFNIRGTRLDLLHAHHRSVVTQRTPHGAIQSNVDDPQRPHPLDGVVLRLAWRSCTAHIGQTVTHTSWLMEAMVSPRMGWFQLYLEHGGEPLFYFFFLWQVWISLSRWIKKHFSKKNQFVL